MSRFVRWLGLSVLLSLAGVYLVRVRPDRRVVRWHTLPSGPAVSGTRYCALAEWSDGSVSIFAPDTTQATRHSPREVTVRGWLVDHSADQYCDSLRVDWIRRQRP